MCRACPRRSTCTERIRGRRAWCAKPTACPATPAMTTGGTRLSTAASAARVHSTQTWSVHSRWRRIRAVAARSPRGFDCCVRRPRRRGEGLAEPVRSTSDSTSCSRARSGTTKGQLRTCAQPPAATDTRAVALSDPTAPNRTADQLLQEPWLVCGAEVALTLVRVLVLATVNPPPLSMCAEAPAVEIQRHDLGPALQVQFRIRAVAAEAASTRGAIINLPLPVRRVSGSPTRHQSEAQGIT
mmetsp:Transcript_26786/g.44798  ORF Transcript_26786/g.44798 Transcript_26786/m.44798 type:complete len:241 (+) Transcript_26786:734-1456(+)